MKQFYDLAGGVSKIGAFVWDTDALAWVRMTQPGAPAMVMRKSSLLVKMQEASKKVITKVKLESAKVV
jgi:hypothetical protein